MFHWFAPFALLCLVLPSANGHSNRAGTCIGGKSAPGVEHRKQGYEERSIDAGRITIFVGDNILDPDKVLGVYIGETYRVTVEKATPFKGIMTTISGGDANIDTSEVIILDDDEEALKRNDMCGSTTAGISHTDAQEKYNVSWTMEWTEKSENMVWDMNIVETKTPISRFYYNKYLVTSLNPGETLPPQPVETIETTKSPTPPVESGAVHWKMTTVAVMTLLATATLGIMTF